MLFSCFCGVNACDFSKYSVAPPTPRLRQFGGMLALIGPWSFLFDRWVTLFIQCTDRV